MKRWWAACVFAIGALVVNAAAAAVPYPNRPVRLIVPSGAGGITDIIGRNIADRLTTNLGQQVIVDNRPGASGIVGSLIVAKAPPDGHTLLMAFPSHPVNPSLYPDIPFDTERAFAPITLVSAVAPVLIVSAQFPARSVQDLIAIAKAKPGQLNHGSVGRGSMGSLAAELLRTTAGIRFQQVAYKGAPQALTAVMGGEVDFYLIGSAGTVVPHVQAGRLRALGVGVRERISVLPDVPPIADAVPGYEARGWNGILAPAGTPPAIVGRLHREIVKIVHGPEFARMLLGEGATAVGNTPAEFAAVIRNDVAKWRRIVSEAGIKGD